MKISELKRIAKENDYELNKSLEHYKLTHKYCDNYISINGLCKNRLWISIPFCCDERDFNMIKAAVEFAETAIEDREEEKSKIYIVYDCSDESIKRLSKYKTKALAKVSRDALFGERIDNYKLIEINLDEVEDD